MSEIKSINGAVLQSTYSQKTEGAAFTSTLPKPQSILDLHS